MLPTCPSPHATESGSVRCRSHRAPQCCRWCNLGQRRGVYDTITPACCGEYPELPLPLSASLPAITPGPAGPGPQHRRSIAISSTAMTTVESGGHAPIIVHSAYRATTHYGYSAACTSAADGLAPPSPRSMHRPRFLLLPNFPPQSASRLPPRSCNVTYVQIPLVITYREGGTGVDAADR